MDSDGGFHIEEEDGKLFQVYHHPKYHPIPQTQSQISSNETASDNKLLFLCPDARRQNHVSYSESDSFSFNSSPEYVLSTVSTQLDMFSLGPGFKALRDHPVLPLVWTNNPKFDDDGGGCSVCYGSSFGTEYYFCDIHRCTYHKECVESPLQINHPYHPQHPLQLYFHYYSDSTTECLCCGRRSRYMVYHCTICQVFMHPICAMKQIPFVIDPPKRHEHPLTFFPRQTSLICNICGLLRKVYPTYICARCNFVAHKDCMNSPRIIKISRHHHRISYMSSLPSGEWCCGVCRQSIDSDYGAYTCAECGDYAVHLKCALRTDVWDGVEHEGVEEEDDIRQDAEPFDTISEGVILHFLHNHILELRASMLYDENKICQACTLPVYKGNFYSCMECAFILHETCAKARRRIQHALHPHPLTLKAFSGYGSGIFGCDACGRSCCGGFVYQCPIRRCNFDIDVRCAAVSEPFDYKGHEHPLFLSLDPGEKPICQVCQIECHKQLNCITCDFIVCIKCATLPYQARYKHDKHFLTVLWGEEVCETDWCEGCERNLRDTCTKVIYWCKECCTTLHIDCLFGGDPYLRPGQFLELNERKIKVLGNSNIYRPFCKSCENPCQGKILKRGGHIACSVKCGRKIFTKDI